MGADLDTAAGWHKHPDGVPVAAVQLQPFQKPLVLFTRPSPLTPFDPLVVKGAGGGGWGGFSAETITGSNVCLLQTKIYCILIHTSKYIVYCIKKYMYIRVYIYICSLPNRSMPNAPPVRKHSSTPIWPQEEEG